MNVLYRDIVISLMFLFGITGFISGQYILSSVSFGMAAILSNSHLQFEKNMD